MISRPPPISVDGMLPARSRGASISGRARDADVGDEGVTVGREDPAAGTAFLGVVDHGVADGERVFLTGVWSSEPSSFADPKPPCPALSWPEMNAYRSRVPSGDHAVSSTP